MHESVVAVRTVRGEQDPEGCKVGLGVRFEIAVVDTPFLNGEATSTTLTPGIRTHLGRDWYFLAGLPIPVTKERVGEIGMIFWFMKAW
jgi:hypothetical protein